MQPQQAQPAASASPLRIGVVGAGLMGRWHAHAARRLGERVVAFADRNVALARTLAEPMAADSFGDVDQMLDSSELDVLHICTPSDSHVPLSLKGVAAGLHVFVEKPLGELAEETRSVLRAAEDEGVIVCPTHQYAFQRGVARAREGLKTLGDVSHYVFNYCSAGGLDRKGAALDAVIGEIFPHPFSILYALMPKAEFDREAWSVEYSRPGELIATGRHGGTLVSIVTSLGGRPTCFNLTVRAAGGKVFCDFFHGYGYVVSGRASRFRKVVNPFAEAGLALAVASENLLRRTLTREPAYPGLRTLMRRFYAAVRGTEPNPIPPDEVAAIAEWREAVLLGSLPGWPFPPGPIPDVDPG